MTPSKTIEFDKTGVSETDVEKIDRINETLARLRGRRKSEIIPEGPLLKSKLAWKVANYQQAILYRIVMLTSGCALNWNFGNSLCSILAARAIVETVALFLEFESRLEELLARSDFGGINKLIDNRTFASRDEEYLKENPDLIATNVITFIDKIDQELLRGARHHYDFLSEVCHPNSFGHFFFFGSLDTQTGITTFSDNKMERPGWNHIYTAVLLIQLVENGMSRLDDTILRLADLHGAAYPVKDS